MLRLAMSLIGFVIFFSISTSAYAIGVPRGFTQENVAVRGARFNVYKGGSGDALVLLHGYAESALMWEEAMKRLRDHYLVIVPDLRGAGLSEATEGGYTKADMAKDVKALLDHYGVTKAHVIGHDVGLMVAYAFAAQFPDMTTKLVVMDAFLPGIGPGEMIYNSPDIWHFRVHGPFAEKLVKGREKIYLDALWTGFSADPRKFSNAKKNYFARQYAAKDHMRAGFEWFRMFPQDAADNQEFAKGKLTMPVLSIGGEKALGVALGDSMKIVAPQTEVVVLPATGHWLMEENPSATLQALEDFLSR